MYEHDYDDCANEEQFTEETLQDGLRQLITDGCDSLEICWENLRVQTFAEAGLMTRDCGLVIALPTAQNSSSPSFRAGDTPRLTMA